MKTILVLTRQDDNASVQAVLKQLEAEGHQIILFYGDAYLSHWTISSTCINGNWDILLKHTDGRKFKGQDIDAVWMRRLADLGKTALEELEPMYQLAAFEEVRYTFLGFMNSLTQAFHFNHYMQNRIAEIKEWQMKIATELGLLQPKSCITNDPEVLREFIKTCENGVISKMQGSSLVKKDGESLFVMTNKLDESQLEDLEGIRYTPMVFQEFIPKTIEYRATIIGKEIFTIALDTSQKEVYEVDWRREAHSSTGDWVKAQLPKDIEEKLLAYMDYFHLNYGAADILLSPDGQHYFLEVNPGGEFGWADAIWEGKIAEAIANILSGKTAHRSCSPMFL